VYRSLSKDNSVFSLKKKQWSWIAIILFSKENNHTMFREANNYFINKYHFFTLNSIITINPAISNNYPSVVADPLLLT
jgi:hypothetical protein